MGTGSCNSYACSELVQAVICSERKLSSNSSRDLDALNLFVCGHKGGLCAFLSASCLSQRFLIFIFKNKNIRDNKIKKVIVKNCILLHIKLLF